MVHADRMGHIHSLAKFILFFINKNSGKIAVVVDFHQRSTIS